MRNPLYKGVNKKEVNDLKKHSSKKNVNININILNNANFSSSKCNNFVKNAVIIFLFIIIGCKLLTISESGFITILDKLLEVISSIEMAH